MSNMALEVAPFCTRVLAPFYLRVSKALLDDLQGQLEGALQQWNYLDRRQ